MQNKQDWIIKIDYLRNSKSCRYAPDYCAKQVQGAIR